MQKRFLVSADAVPIALGLLVWLSTPFSVEPYPDGEWCVSIKAGENVPERFVEGMPPSSLTACT